MEPLHPPDAQLRIDQLGIVGTVAPGIFAQPGRCWRWSTSMLPAMPATARKRPSGGVVTATPRAGGQSGHARGTSGSWKGLREAHEPPLRKFSEAHPQLARVTRSPLLDVLDEPVHPNILKVFVNGHGNQIELLSRGSQRPVHDRIDLKGRVCASKCETTKPTVRQGIEHGLAALVKGGPRASCLPDHQIVEALQISSHRPAGAALLTRKRVACTAITPPGVTATVWGGLDHCDPDRSRRSGRQLVGDR